MAEQKPVMMPRRAGPARPAPAPSGTFAMTPKEAMGVLRRHWLLIAVFTVVGLGCGGGLWWLLSTKFPLYTARTYVEVLRPTDQDPMEIAGQLPNKDLMYEYRVTIASEISSQNTFMQLLENEDVRRTSWFGQFGDNNVDAAIQDLKANFGAAAQRDSRFVELSMTCGSAADAATIVNEMVTYYTRTRRTQKQNEIGSKLRAVQEQANRIESELAVATKAMEEVQAAFGITDLDRSPGQYWRHTITVRLEDLELQKNQLELAIRQTEADIKNLERLAQDEIISVQIRYAVESDPVVQLLSEQISFQEAQLQGRLSRFGENHREVILLKDSIEKLREEKQLREDKIANEMRQANVKNAYDRYAVLQERMAELNKLTQEAQAEKADLDMARIQYAQRKEIREERMEMRDALKEQIEKLQIMQQDPEAQKVRAMGTAPRPIEQVLSRQMFMHVPAGGMLGLLLGTALAFLLEMMNDLLRTPRDVSRYVRVRLLGVIPDSSEDRQTRGIEPAHTVRQAPFSITSESYRRLQANFALSDRGRAKTVLVTAGMTGDGTTTVASNLAISSLADDRKVLFIDANFRRPSLQNLFPSDASSDAGLSTLLMGQCRASDAVHSSGIPGLDVMYAGPMPANPAELLRNSRIKDVLGTLAQSYDEIIIDGAPVLLVSDSKALAKVADATLLVFNAAATRRGAAQRSVGEIEAVGGNVAGAVLFGAVAMKGGYFNEQFKSYRKYQKVQMASAAPAAAAAAPTPKAPQTPPAPPEPMDFDDEDEDS